LWIKDYPAPDNEITRRLGPVDPVIEYGQCLMLKMQWLGYSLENGELLWGQQTQTFGLITTGSGESADNVVTAYGNLYVQGFGGEFSVTTIKTELCYGNTTIRIAA
jgi:hypothetical protein